MATLQSPGIGSGLDIASLVKQLVAVERQPLEQRLNRRESQINAEISALGTLKSALSNFKTALEKLKSVDVFLARTAKSGDTDVFEASASSKAAPGSYDIEVVQLAQAHQLASAAFADGAASVVGTGTLTITVGATTFSVEIGEDASTLADIRDAINAASGNPGVRATLIHGTDGSRLVLTSHETGAQGAIRVTAEGGDGGLEALVYDPGTATSLTEIRAATNAVIRIAGFEHESSSNEITGAIDGVTLSLKQAAPGTQIRLDVAYDTDAIAQRVKDFVAEYNKLNTQLSSLRSYDPTSQRAGPLLGDALLRSIESQIRRGLTDPIEGLSGDYTALVNLGIKTTSTGALTLDESKLKEALSADLEAVAKIFGGENGVAARLYEGLEARLASDAEIDTRTQALQRNQRSLTREREMLDVRMEAIHERYMKQFTALDSLLMTLQSTSSYLAQQLANLPKPGGGSKD